MDKKYLENYQAKEDEEYERLVIRKVKEGKFDFEKDKYPPDNRFVKLQRPITDSSCVACYAEDRWDQVPFNGSTIFQLDALQPALFEKLYFRISEIPKVIDFIKDTGKVQIVLRQPPEVYAGLDYLDPFFKELEPPQIRGINLLAIGSEKELKSHMDTFHTLSKIRIIPSFSDLISTANKEFTLPGLIEYINECSYVFAFLKLRYPAIAEEVENALVDSPPKADEILKASGNFILDPFSNLRYDSLSFSLGEISQGKRILGQAIDPDIIGFPYEVGKFLLRKLTYAPMGLRACNELIDHYDSYDLQRVCTSLSEAIRSNHPDVVEKNLASFSEILDNVWNDKTIVNRIKGLNIGLPFSLAAIGSIAAGPLGGIGGLLAGLGFDAVNRILEANVDGLDEKIVKKLSQSYQVNIYDFKKKYDSQIVS